MRCAHSAVDYLTDVGGGGGTTGEWSVEKGHGARGGRRYPYCTERSTAGIDVFCVFAPPGDW